MKIDSLSEKLILYFVLLGIGAIMIISTVSFYSTREALMGRTFDQLISLRIVKKNQIDQFYADRARDITFMAGTGCSASGRGPSPGVERKITGRLRSPGQYFTAYYILGKELAVAQGCFNDSASAGAPAIPEHVFALLRDQLKGEAVVISDVNIDKHTGNPYQLMATEIPGIETKINSEKDILVVAVSMDAINAIMLNNDPLSGLGLSGETYLVGPDLRMRSISRFQPASILKTSVKTQSVSDALAGKTGCITTNDYRGIPVLSSYGMIGVPGLKWAILAEIDVQEAMVPIYETRTRILLLSMIMIVVFFGSVLFVSRRITKPLIRLRDATVNLGKGKFEIDLPVETRDEIGALTESFNIMARQIKEKTTELQLERFGRIRSVFDGEEMERQRLSRELHDGIGQSLIAIKLRLENLLYQDGKDIRNSIQELKNYFDQIIDEVRRISNNLMPSVLEVFSIPIAFRNLFSETEEHSGLRIHFEAKGNFDDLDKKIKTYIYRLTQEALNNIVKHAEANDVRVYLTRIPERLTLVIRDNGKGFSPESVGKDGGNGIHNMRERASLLQGQIDIQSAPSKGTTITVNVPIIITYVKNQDFPRG
ncbi:MAG: sensor histidine kinase [Bacteroidetes bacterium]|nr:sensor histidine kinase [Bacteroidota bacterium]